MSDPVSLPTRLDALRAALHELMARAQWVGDSDEVLVAVQEAVVNASNHGFGVREVAARVGGTELVVEIADHGEGFDPTGYLAHRPDVLAEAGRGVWLMGQIATEVELSHEPDGARVRLRFTTGEVDDRSAAPSAQAAFQRALMPSVPDVDGLALGATYHPAKASWLGGGGFYDAFELPAGHGVVVGDVSGRGPDAAAAGVTARAYLRATLASSGVTGAVPAINRALCHELDAEQFVTMAMVTRESVDLWTLTLCGHPPPLLYRGGHVTSLRSRGTVLGLYEDPEWSRQPFRLESGDVLLLYTDGVTEAGSPSEQFGITRLATALEELAHQPPQRLVETIDARLHRFAGDNTTDDHVLMAVSRL